MSSAPYRHPRGLPYPYPPRRPAYRHYPGYGPVPPFPRRQRIYDEQRRIEEIQRINRNWQERNRHHEEQSHLHTLVKAVPKNLTMGMDEAGQIQAASYYIQQLTLALARDKAKNHEVVDLTSEEGPSSSVEPTTSGTDILAMACAELGDLSADFFAPEQPALPPTSHMVSEYLEEIESGGVIPCSSQNPAQTNPPYAAGDLDGSEFQASAYGSSSEVQKSSADEYFGDFSSSASGDFVGSEFQGLAYGSSLEVQKSSAYDYFGIPQEPTIETAPEPTEIGDENYLEKELDEFDRILQSYQNGTAKSLK